MSAEFRIPDGYRLVNSGDYGRTLDDLSELVELRVRVVQLETQLAAREAADAEYEDMRQWATSPEQVQAMFDHFRRQREDAAVGAWVRANPPADIRMHSTQYRVAALAAGSSLTPEEPT